MDDVVAHGQGTSPEDLEKKLIKEFGAVLDGALILAIASDRDIQSQYDEIRSDLLALADCAGAEEATGFDPSGMGGGLADLEQANLDEAGTMGNVMLTSDRESLVTDNCTTISDSSGSSEPQRFSNQANLSDAEKIDGLRLIFPNFKDHTMSYILRESRGDLDLAFELLLNRQFLHDSKQLPKGIDAFVSDAEQQVLNAKIRPGRARPEKTRQNLAIDYAVVSPTTDSEELEGAKGPVKLPMSQIAGKTSARRVAPASPSYPVSDWRTVPASKTMSLGTSSSAARPAAEFSNSHLRAVTKLNRLGPLGRQGAIVYTERARDEARMSAGMTLQMAERYVAQQSDASKTDLHGVTVLDGVRIAKQRVWQWWNNLGENRESLAKHQGFTVITGVGHHSAGGVSRLRQAVGVALKNDGWKMETLTGQFYVTGRA
ncbi:hypothetical protein B0T22DRAFT_448676 [Podospora appendiculata]|uniref:Smr domain-containing protein n=1 Tax=Podospora appendiculata TaxID=314037 RepID=A0AAE1CFS2_9PEZI|nr:hypothetical protein B0T22DRAFT_448676 [Podospora appendiculata]